MPYAQISLLELQLLSAFLHISCVWFGNKWKFSLPGLEIQWKLQGFVLDGYHRDKIPNKTHSILCVAAEA